MTEFVGLYLTFGLGLSIGAASWDEDFGRLPTPGQVIGLVLFTAAWPLLVWRAIRS